MLNLFLSTRDINPSRLCPYCDFQRPDCLCAIGALVANDQPLTHGELIEKALGVSMMGLYLDGMI